MLAGSMLEFGGELLDKNLSRYLVSQALWEQASNENREELAARAKDLKELLNPKEPSSVLDDFHTIGRGAIYIGSEIVNEFTLTRGQVDKEVEAILPRLEDALNLAFKRADLERSKIDRVLMVGGSSYLRRIQDFMEEYFSKGGRNLSLNNGRIILRDPEAAIAFGAALYQYDKLRGKESFRSTLSLETYLKYEMGNGKWTRHTLGCRGTLLPIPRTPPILLRAFRAFLFEDLPLPRDKNKTEWYVCQERLEKGGEEPEPRIVEKVTIQKYKPGYTSRLRICYRIDEEENLTYWQPYLITDRRFAVKTKAVTETSLYDLEEDDIPRMRRRMGINIAPKSKRRMQL